MKISWNTTLYKNVRRNICKWSDENSEPLQIAYSDDFINILEEYDAYVESNGKSFSVGQVVDRLGMNENYSIVFNDSDKYLLFLLKWS